MPLSPANIRNFLTEQLSREGLLTDSKPVDRSPYLEQAAGNRPDSHLRLLDAEPEEHVSDNQPSTHRLYGVLWCYDNQRYWVIELFNDDSYQRFQRLAVVWRQTIDYEIHLFTSNDGVRYEQLRS